LARLWLPPPPQGTIDRQLRRFRPAGPLIGLHLRGAGPVAALPVTAAGHFPRDRRHAPAKSRRDLPHRLTPSQPERDLLPLTERQVTPLQVTPPARAHPAGLPHPRQPPRRVGMRDRRRIG